MSGSEGASPPASRRGRLVWALLIVVPAAAGSAYGMLGGEAPAAPTDEDQPQDSASPTSSIYEAPELIVNLAESRGQRYLKVRLGIQLTGSQPEAAKARLEGFQAQLRDRLIRLLSDKTIDRVESWGAKESIKLEILDMVNRSVLGDGIATAEQVFFMEFLIQ